MTPEQRNGMEMGTVLKGWLTEKNLPEAEQEWPGIGQFFQALEETEKPGTFLELVWKFESVH